MVFNWCTPDEYIVKPATPVVERKSQFASASSRSHRDGDLIALVENHLEKLQSITDDSLEFNQTIGRVLVKYPLNERDFDVYVGLPFTKGLTERQTGRTQLILGTKEHHISAMQNQFSGVKWDDVPSFGDCIRWVNVGGVKTGFIGLDYNPSARDNGGVAKSPEDVQFLANTLIQYGYNPEKRLFLINPPHLHESAQGRASRQRGFRKLRDYIDFKT